MKKITRFHAVKILEWCKKRYGRGVKPYPILEFRKPNYLNGEYAQGEYDYEEEQKALTINWTEITITTIIQWRSKQNQ